MSTSLAANEHGYLAPALELGLAELGEGADAVLWVVGVGLVYATALLWVYWCRRSGGSGEIAWSWTSGFKVICRK